MPEVARPAQRRVVESLIPDIGIGSEAQEGLCELHAAHFDGSMQRGMPRLIARHVGSAQGVDIEAQVDQELHGSAPTLHRRPSHESSALITNGVGEVWVPTHELGDGGTLDGKHRSDERLGGLQVRAGRGWPVLAASSTGVVAPNQAVASSGVITSTE